MAVDVVVMRPNNALPLLQGSFPDAATVGDLKRAIATAPNRPVPLVSRAERARPPFSFC